MKKQPLTRKQKQQRYRARLIRQLDPLLREWQAALARDSEKNLTEKIQTAKIPAV